MLAAASPADLFAARSQMALSLGWHLVGSWWNPTSLLGGVLAVGVCAWLAAAYLTADAARAGRPELAERFRRRGLLTGAVVGALPPGR